MEKVYHVMKTAGIFNVVMGIVTIVFAAAAGTFAIIHGARLLNRKNDITF